MNGYTGAEWSRRKQGLGQEHSGRMPEACARGFDEQQWIDWLLGSVSEPQRVQMAEHLDACTVCLEHKLRWENILEPGAEDAALSLARELPLDHGHGVASTLQDRENMAWSKEANAPLAAQVKGAPLSALLPSNRIRRSLRRRVRVIGLQRKGRQWLHQLKLHRQWLMPLAATVMVLIGLVLGASRVNEPASQWNRYVEAYEPEALPVMSKPDTMSYPIVWGPMQPEGGMVWYNAASGEMLMLVGGLVPEKDQSIRVWLVKEGTRDSLGVLQYHANRAHLYVKDRPLGITDDLELTIELQGSEMEPSSAQHVISLDLLGR